MREIDLANQMIASPIKCLRSSLNNSATPIVVVCSSWLAGKLIFPLKQVAAALLFPAQPLVVVLCLRLGARRHFKWTRDKQLVFVCFTVTSSTLWARIILSTSPEMARQGVVVVSNEPPRSPDIWLDCLLVSRATSFCAEPSLIDVFVTVSRLRRVF